jgi:hypothetical protein
MNDYVNDPRALNIPWVLSPFFEASLATRDLTPDQVAMARGYREKGYHVLEDPVVDEAVLDRVVRDMQGRYTDTQTGYPHPSRKLDAWREVASVAEVARAPSVLEALALLYGRRPFPFQTLNFERGTQQRAHSDTIHFHSVPERFMAGVWVALEDIHPDSGPIVVYPGSHHLPVLDPLDLGFEATWDNHDRYEDAIEAVVEAAGLEPLSLSLRKGQAVIWAANLLHGGEAVRDPARTRLSQANHYYFDDCFYYQPAASDPFVGRLALKDVEEVGTGRKVPNLYRGRPVDEWLRGNRPLVARLFGR